MRPDTWMNGPALWQVLAATLDEHEDDTIDEHEFVNMVSPSSSLPVA
jgi:hypothetical protein